MTRIKFLNGMGERASQPNGRSPAPQGRVRSANAPGTYAGDTSANKNPTKNYRKSATSAGSLSDQFPAGWPILDVWMRQKTGPRRSANCCAFPRSDPLEQTHDFTSRFSEVTSQLRKHGGVSFLNAQPAPGAPVGLTFDTRSLSSGCDSGINTESQGDLSCRRNKRTRLPRSVRLPYENRTGDRIW